MPDPRVSGSRRKRLSSAQAGSSSNEGAGGSLRSLLLVVLALIIVVWLVAPNQIDRALAPIASTTSSKAAEANRIWTTVVSALSSEDLERNPTASPGPALSSTALHPNETVITAAAPRTILTRRHDTLEVGPDSAIAVDESDPDGLSTIIRLINGTIHVDAAKRTGEETFSVETMYLIATVKGTAFDVVISERGAAVSVTEGVVRARAAGSTQDAGVDVTPGNTAAVSAVSGAMPMVGPTPSGGPRDAIEAARASSPVGEPVSGAFSGHRRGWRPGLPDL